MIDMRRGGSMSEESTAEAAARIRAALGNRRDSEAVGVTAVSGRMAAYVLSAFGVDPAEPPDDPPGLPTVSLLDVSDGVVAVEDGGRAAPEHNALRWLSQGGEAASLYWDGSGNIALALARDGVVLRSRDAALVDGLDPAVLGLVSCGLIVVERFTGLRIDGDSPQVPVREYLTRATHGRLMPDLGAIRAAALVDDDDEDRSVLSAAISRLDPYEQRRLAKIVAGMVLGIAELHAEPEIVEALDWLMSPVGPRFSEAIQVAMLQARDVENQGVRSSKARALRVLATAANADPHLAALEAVWGVRDVLAPEARVNYDANVHKHIRGVIGT
jgi:hypothetical protein